MSSLEKAIVVATQAHVDQLDKLGAPYILHPLRVMLKVSSAARIAAVLHDVIEDTCWDYERLVLAGFDRSDVDAIEALTRRSGETYEDFVLRCSVNPIAREVKIADIADNLAPERFSLLPLETQARLGPRYRSARSLLQGMSR